MNGKISWMDKVTNEDVLNVNKDEQILNSVVILEESP